VIGGGEVHVTPTTARVSWRTNFAATTQGAFGVGERPLFWTAPGPSAAEHETVFSGLTPSTRYRLWLRAEDERRRPATVVLEVVTADAPSWPSPEIADGRILVHDRPFFPLAVWDECADTVASKLALGINLFLSNGCGHDLELVSALRGRAFAAVDAHTGLVGLPGLLGWYYTDELDARIPGNISEADLNALTPQAPDGLLSFLTLTNHFYSRAEPLPAGRAFYPALVARTDVLGFDLYPMQNWCRTDGFDHVYDAQRELENLAGGKPTFQWIEVRMMDCLASHLDPTVETVQAETWLAVAGGADGIGWFPNTWSEQVGAEIERLNAKLTELAPALLAPKLESESSNAPVKVGARTLGGAIYVIAVNSIRAPVESAIRVPGLGARTVTVLDERRTVTALNDVITDRFEPLGVHVYVAAPPGWD
jgi:hypothetical protein